MLVQKILNLQSIFFYLDDNDVDYDDYYDDGWIDELADDEHLVDLHCDNFHFESDVLVLSSVYSFLVDDKNRSHYPIVMLPHYFFLQKHKHHQNYLEFSSRCYAEHSIILHLQSSSRPSKAIALRSFIDPKMHINERC